MSEGRKGRMGMGCTPIETLRMKDSSVTFPKLIEGTRFEFGARRKFDRQSPRSKRSDLAAGNGVAAAGNSNPNCGRIWQ